MNFSESWDWGIIFLVGGDSKYIYVGPFSLKLSQVLDLFTKQRIFCKFIREDKPYTSPRTN